MYLFSRADEIARRTKKLENLFEEIKNVERNFVRFSSKHFLIWVAHPWEEPEFLYWAEELSFMNKDEWWRNVPYRLLYSTFYFKLEFILEFPSNAVSRDSADLTLSFTFFSLPHFLIVQDSDRILYSTSSSFTSAFH